MAHLIQRSKVKLKMVLGKSKNLKVSPKKSTLDQVLWMIENYLPNKKKRINRKEFHLKELEADTIYQIQSTR